MKIFVLVKHLKHLLDRSKFSDSDSLSQRQNTGKLMENEYLYNNDCTSIVTQLEQKTSVIFRTGALSMFVVRVEDAIKFSVVYIHFFT